MRQRNGARGVPCGWQTVLIGLRRFSLSTRVALVVICLACASAACAAEPSFTARVVSVSQIETCMTASDGRTFSTPRGDGPVFCYDADELTYRRHDTPESPAVLNVGDCVVLRPSHPLLHIERSTPCPS
jgi:hypothetical protein